MAQFKLLAGKYVHGKQVDKETGKVTPTPIVYVRGDVVDSDLDLAEKFPGKFERLGDKAKAAAPAPRPKPPADDKAGK